MMTLTCANPACGREFSRKAYDITNDRPCCSKKCAAWLRFGNDSSRKRTRGKTAERGYGGPHAAERKRLLGLWRPGDPCARCGGPMLDASFIDLGHTDDRSGWTGLEHSACNRRHGAMIRNGMAL